MSMYDLVIVDDEAYILRQMRALFAWEEMGFRVVGAFQSGLDCLRFAQEHPVDVLLTDIRLGEMTGLELAAAMRERLPALEIVLLSAYSEFEYAREALSLGVTEYLLKPIGFEDIRRCFSRLRSRMDERLDMESELIALQQSKVYSDIFYGVAEHPEVAACGDRLYRMLSLEFSEKAFSERYRHELNLVTTEAGASTCVALFELRPGMLSVLLIFESPVQDRAQRVAEQCLERFPFVRDANITDAYADVLALAADYRSSVMQTIEEQSTMNQMRAYLNSNEQEAADKFLVTYMKCRKFDLKQATAFAGKLLEGDVQHIGAAKTIEEVAREVCRAFGKNGSSETPEQRIAAVLTFIDDNLSTDISLEKAAQQCSLTPSYFSRLFKQVTGERFITHLVRRRIECAKALLEDETVKIDDIPNRVGYYSRSYFYKIFVAETGMTLAEYRRQALEEKP